MKSCAGKRSYVILHDEDRYPYQINRVRTDKALEKIQKALHMLCDEIKALDDEEHNDILNVLDRFIFSPACLDIDDGKADWRLRQLMENIDEFREELAAQHDEILPYEEVALLEDYGFEKDWGALRWEKKIEDTDEKEVIEEILAGGETPLRRERTTCWEKTDYGKTSRKITYKKLPMSKKLELATANSVALRTQAN